MTEEGRRASPWGNTLAKKGKTWHRKEGQRKKPQENRRKRLAHRKLDSAGAGEGGGGGGPTTKPSTRTNPFPKVSLQEVQKESKGWKSGR